MKNLRKRALSLLLAAVMTASLLPTTPGRQTEYQHGRRKS